MNFVFNFSRVVGSHLSKYTTSVSQISVFFNQELLVFLLVSYSTFDSKEIRNHDGELYHTLWPSSTSGIG